MFAVLSTICQQSVAIVSFDRHAIRADVLQRTKERSRPKHPDPIVQLVMPNLRVVADTTIGDQRTLSLYAALPRQMPFVRCSATTLLLFEVIDDIALLDRDAANIVNCSAMLISY